MLQIDNKSLTLESKVKGSEAGESITFLINEDTQKPSGLAVGFEVTVEYKEQVDVKIATVITIEAPAVKP